MCVCLFFLKKQLTFRLTETPENAANCFKGWAQSDKMASARPTGAILAGFHICKPERMALIKVGAAPTLLSAIPADFKLGGGGV